MNNTTKQNYFLSQPHQPFFILGVVNAIIMMLIFALSYKGIFTLETQSLNFHVYSLVFLLFTNVFTGFLFTTFPRFNQADVISKNYYSKIFYTSSTGAILYIVAIFISHTLLLIAMGILLLSQIFTVLKLQEIYRDGRAPEKKDSFWILVAQYFGLIGHFLFIEVELNNYIGLNIDILPLAINISFYLYLIFLAFSVAQRMIPFFSHSFAPKNENFVKIVFTLFILKSLSSTIGLSVAEIGIDLLLAIYLFLEFKRWELSPQNAPAILWVLHLALLWLPVAFLLSAITLVSELFLETSFYYLNTHLLSIGFLTTVLIGFGTRVTLGHSGQAPHADKFAATIFWFIQVVVLGRVLFSLNVAFGWGLGFLFDISFFLWVLLFLAWGLRYAKVLVFGSKL